MSRRESRVSMGAKQNDALFEFENFKKKFLLANKHITKLNSTLSVRIEELNAQISSLYVENLRLRASEIALAAQLKREREKSQKVMAEAEAATLNLTKHLGYLRQSFNIPSEFPAPISPHSPRARKPPSNPNPSPALLQANRISRPPNFPGIHEDDEQCLSTSDDERDKQPSPSLRKSKAKPRLSASRLPLPSRATSPPPLTLSHSSGAMLMTPHPIPSAKARKTSRRQSGLLAVTTEALSVPRAPSPAFGSPIRREAGLAEEEEELAAVANQLQVAGMDVDVEMEVRTSPKKVRRKSRGKERELAEEQDPGVEVSRPRERKRIKEKMQEDTDGGGKPHLKDVTNSRAALIPIDNTLHGEPDISSGRALLGASPTPSAPTSRSSSSPAPPGDHEGSAGGRERRVRKSVNYAEPKLNTKMRKPDPAPGDMPKKRASAAAVLSAYRFMDDNGNDADNDTEARSSIELPLRINGNPINPESFPLPPSRPGSSVSLFSPTPATTHIHTTSSSSSSSTATTAVKRKKSRTQLFFDDDESDGAQADAEHGVGSGWVNLEGRRRIATGSSGKRGPVVVDDPRRHSMAV